MLFDERIADLVRRKYSFAERAANESFLWEALRFVQWLFEEDLTRPYALQIVRSDDAERAAYAGHLSATVAEAATLRDELVRLVPSLVSTAIPAMSIEHDESVAAFDALARATKTLEEEHADLTREPGRDQSVAERLTRILGAIAASTLATNGPADDGTALGYKIGALRERHRFRFTTHSNRLVTSPALAVHSLCEVLRALAPPAGERPEDWMPFLPYDWAQSTVLASKLSSGGSTHDLERLLAESRQNLARVHEEMLATMGTSLSSESLILRFKERCTWFDKRRMRNVADDTSLGAVREDRLTLELAKYLHDNGVFVLVRARVSNLEPDVIAPPLGRRRLVLESKVYDAGSSAAASALKGFWQLHAYLTSLETTTTRAEEGFLVIFRLGGAICETPQTIETGRFLIHILTIDLGLGVDSGSSQPRTTVVSREMLLDAVKGAHPPEETPLQDGSGGQDAAPIGAET